MEFGINKSSLYFWVLVIITLLIALWYLMRLAYRIRERRLARCISPELTSRLSGHFRPVARRPLDILVLFGFLMLAVALLQPKWGFHWEELRSLGRDIVIVLDVSESMRATDITPSRLERARLKVAGMLMRGKGDRFGLIAFSGGAATLCPVTMDHGYFRTTLEAVHTDTISLKGSSITAGLEEAIVLLKDEEDEDRESKRDTRAVVLISDGEDTGYGAIAAAEELSRHARLFVLGVGTSEGATIARPSFAIPRPGVPSLPAAHGEVHTTRLDEAALTRIAAAGTGMYFRARIEDDDLDALFERLNMLSSSEGTGQSQLRYINRFQIPLVLALFSFAAEGLWLTAMPYWTRKEKKRRRPRQSIILPLLLFCMSLCAVAYAESVTSGVRRANALIRVGESERAIDLLNEIQVTNPNNSYIEYALGCALYDLGEKMLDTGDVHAASDQFERAEAAFERASTDKHLARSARFNAANARTRIAKSRTAGEPVEKIATTLLDAASKYLDILKEYPDDEAALQNLDHVRYLLRSVLEGAETPPPSSSEPPEEGVQDNEEEQEGESDADPVSGEESQESTPDSEEEESTEMEESPEDEDESAQEETSPSDDWTPYDIEEETPSLDRSSMEAILESLREQDRLEQESRRRNIPRIRPGESWW